MTASEGPNTNLAIVTGAPGWLGSRLVQSLAEGLADLPQLATAPRKIRILTLKGADMSPLFKESGRLKEQLQQVEGDLASGDGLDRLFADAAGATVFHAAGVIHPNRGRKEFYEVNVEGTRRMLDAATRAGVKRFIHVSSNSPIGCNKSNSKSDLFDEQAQYNPYMHYGASKKLAEDLVNDCGRNNKEGMETVIIRPPWFYGPGQPPRQTLFFTMIKNGKMPIVGSGDNLRSMAYVDNICQGLMLCERVAAAAGQTYWIADSEPYTMNQIVDTVEKVLERDFGISCSHKRFRLPGLASEVAYLIDSLVQGSGMYHQKFHVLSEMNKNIACKIDKARSELGYAPTVALEEGMKRSIAWVLAQGQSI